MEIIRDPNASEEKGKQAKPSTGPVEVKRIAPPPMREMLGPLGVDQAVRQAITQCWMMLPEDERSPERVEKEIRRLVQRALEDMQEDAAAFGFSK
jgi:hypothetical protein